MRNLEWRGLALKLVLFGVLFSPSLTPAQPEAPPARPPSPSAGFYVTPSVSLAGLYDDNVFLSPSRREKDFIARVTPGIEASYLSAPLTLLGRYAFDVERFADHAELDNNQARQDAWAELRYLATPLLTLSIIGTYMDTTTPGELSAVTGIQAGRVRARRVTASPSLTSRFDPLTTGTAGYEFTREESLGIQTDIHSTSLGLERRFTPQDSGSIGYSFRRFSFDGDELSSHLVIFGWARELTPFTTVTLRAGPRFSDGSVDPEGSASIRHRLDRGEVSLTYARSQTTVFGEADVAETDSLTAGLSYSPLAFLELRAGPGFFRTRLAGTDVKVYRATLEATYRITSWLSLTGSYDWSLQRGALGAGPGEPGREDEEIRHNLVMLRLTAASPVRVY